MIEAVIFDMDGVIVDTEPIHAEARNRLLAERRLDVETISPTAIGRSKRSFWGEVVQTYGLSDTADELTKREFELILAIAEKNNLPATDGLEALLRFLRDSKIKAAVASSSDSKYVRRILEIIGLQDYFCVTVGGDQVVYAKPAPDVYLRALQLCGADSGRALAVEDSNTGARAAYAAGISCIAYDAVTDEKLKQIFSTCTYKVTHLRDIEKIIQNENAAR